MLIKVSCMVSTQSMELLKVAVFVLEKPTRGQYLVSLCFLTTLEANQSAVRKTRTAKREKSASNAFVGVALYTETGTVIM